MKFKEFLFKCTECGGNWTAMMLSGIKEVAPEVYDAMPDRTYDFDEIAFIVNHLCYDRPHYRFNLSLSGEIIEHDNAGNFIYRKASEEERSMTALEFHIKYNDPQYKEEAPAVTPSVLSTMIFD